MNYSVTYASNITGFIMSLSLLMGIDLDEGSVTELVQAGLLIAAFIANAYGRYRAGGISALGFKIK
jgi:hypothetical protein